MAIRLIPSLLLVGLLANGALAVTLYNQEQMKGASVSLGQLVPGICYEFQATFKSQTSSLDAQGQCLIAYDGKSCTGSGVNLGPGGHLNLGGWDKKIISLSVRSCSNGPPPQESTTSAPPTSTTARTPGNKINEAGQPPHFKSTEELNKEIVLDFYRELFTEKKIYAVDNYIDAGPQNYIRHNPFVTSGRNIFKGNFEQWFTEPWTTDVMRICADGDLVFVHNRVESKFFNAKLGAKKYVMIVDVFRMENGKLREHWDVLQAVPPPEQTVNNYTMW